MAMKHAWISVALLLATSLPALADSLQSARRYHYEPLPLEAGRSIWTLGLSLTILPEPVVESEVPAPSLDLQFKHGVTDDLAMVASMSTNVVSNVMQLGLQWATHNDHVSFALGNNLIGFYGWLSIEGQFESNWAVALGTAPLVRVGYRFDEFSVSSSFAAVFVLAAESHVGSMRAPGPSTPLNDMFLTIALEQPFLENSSISLGFSVSYSRTPYQSWILFNTVDQFLVIPEVFVGVQL